jgi:hypothetical protein
MRETVIATNATADNRSQTLPGYFHLKLYRATARTNEGAARTVGDATNATAIATNATAISEAK